MKITKKKVFTGVGILVALIVLTFTIVSITMLGIFHKGNKSIYDLENVEVLENSPIDGKNIIFLGSSVTEGMQSRHISFVDYIGKRNNVDFIKEAVSGTTLVDNGKKSYVQRMLKIDKDYEADMFVTQLSTNDATKGLPLGEVSSSTNLDDFDTSTITGSMEYIIAYATETWNVPVVFYTSTYYETDNYDEMVDRLYDLQEKWDIGIIDMWNDEELNDITDAERDLWMRDGTIHPTKAGYLYWYTPAIEAGIIRYMV